ncbi:hypothetical protein BKA56DRAFT_688734 [Ilyonectria sp. MPI-CAGE-AT-0026]|nr:hypothetical protein BKA56DRAFT_688734 [Ilyonectria sp. MPI-CAGE-AT-0026]
MMEDSNEMNMASNTSNSTANNESTTDNQSAERTTTSPDRSADVEHPRFSIDFVLGILLALPLSIVLAFLLRGSEGGSTPPDIIFPPAATSVSFDNDMWGKKPKVCFFTEFLTLSIPYTVEVFPNATRLCAPAKIELTDALRELEHVVEKSHVEPLRVEAWKLGLVLYELHAPPSSEPVFWDKERQPNTHYENAGKRLAWLASEFDRMLQNRMNLAKLLSEEKQGTDGVFKPLKEDVCGWSDGLNLLVSKDPATQDLFPHQQEIIRAYDQVSMMCKMVDFAWQSLLDVMQHLEHDDVEWLKAAVGRMTNWVEEHEDPITREDTLEADEMMKDLVQEYMEKLKLWYYYDY